MKGISMSKVSELGQFNIPGYAEVVAGHGGLPAVQVGGPQAAGRVYLHGGHVAAWKPAGFEEVLWLSEKSLWEAEKPIRGGMPICFPWFGPRAGAAAHGFARQHDWKLESVQQEGGAVTVTLAIDHTMATHPTWPHAYLLRHRITFGAMLTMQLELTNTGTAALTAEEALHTYFALGDVRQARVVGLSGVQYVDKTDNLRQKTQGGDIHITAETDRVYLDTLGTVTVEDPVKKRRIRIAKEYSRDTVVWNPWVAKAKAMADYGDEEWPGMICVETCNVGSHAVTLGPGQKHVMTARILVSAM
jgi:glucose-6-phosphate 1-epimerase